MRAFVNNHPWVMVALIVCGSLAVAELGAWTWLKFRVGYVGPHEAAAHAQVFDHYTFYRLRAGIDGFVLRDGHSCVPGGVSSFRIDRHGLHNPEKGLTLEKPPSEIRIAFFGGSTMFGIGAPGTEKTIAAFAQRELMTRYPGSRIRVINAAMRGYLSIQEYLFYWSKIRQFKPDLVVSFSGHNDGSFAAFVGNQDRKQPLKTAYHIEFEEKVNRQMTWLQDGTLARAPTSRLASELVLRTNLGTAAALIVKRYAPPAGYADTKIRLESFSREFDRTWSARRADTFLMVQDDFRALVERDGSVFLSVIQPSLLAQREPTESERKCVQMDDADFSEMRRRYQIYQQRIRQGARQRQWMHDLTGMFSDIEKTVYVDQAHYNERGQNLVSERIIGLLQSDSDIDGILISRRN